MSDRATTQATAGFAPAQISASQVSGVLQRKCASCGNHTMAGGKCEGCEKKGGLLRRKSNGHAESPEVPPIVHEVLNSPGQPLDTKTRAFFEPRFGRDFSNVRTHTSAKAVESARAVNALAYTVGRDVVFGAKQYSPGTNEGRHLLAHELTHVVQQAGSNTQAAAIKYASDSTVAEHNADAIADAVVGGQTLGPITMAAQTIQRRAAPYIKKITVHLAPPQTADLEWQGTAPDDAPGSDHFTVSTGKGYGDPGDPPGTCTRMCCNDPMTQCAPPWNQPTRVGACCTFYGNTFWTGTPQEEHNGWQWWTPIQPHYSSRGIALHQHNEVTGQPIGHGCVRMDEPNAKRIYDFSNGRRTNVTIDGRAAPVACDESRQCSRGSGKGARGTLAEEMEESLFASTLEEAVPGLEGVMT
ncbi:MAG: eCIS core domain-containing protein [Blastocatellia bacterium]